MDQTHEKQRTKRVFIKNQQTQLLDQTRSRTIKSMVLFSIMHRTRINDPFALIIIKST